jgi:hypothetical protein
MRAPSGRRLTGYLFLCFSAALLACSCRAPAVTGFPWKDAGGASLFFTQSSSWPEGEEGRFAAERRSNRYSLKRSLDLPAGSSIVVELGRGAASEAAPRVRLSLSPNADGSSPLLTAGFPLLVGRASLSLPLDQSSRIGSLVVSAEEPTGSFSIESIRIQPVFRGIDRGISEVRVSSGFSLAKNQGYQELSIKKPFAGLPEPEFAREPKLAREPNISGAPGRPGILLEYGPSSPGTLLRLDAWAVDGSARNYTMRTHPGGARTALDTSILPRDTVLLALRAPEGLEIKSFFAAELSVEDYELADLGRVLLSDSPIAGFSVYRWDLLPSVLVFDFKDYGTQDRYLKRLAFFVEKIGFRGTLVKDEDLAALHGWNAHDYGPEDLAAFFRAAKERSFPLNPEEKELEGLLLRDGLIMESGGKLEPGKGAMISIARESGAALRWTFAVHESTHAIFFSDADYRGFARSLWSSLDQKEKWFWKTYLGWAGYDTGSDYLMGNEFQAYLLQQPIAASEDYFTKRKSSELLEKHPELEEKVAAYMAAYGTSFAQRARLLEAWLFRKYGIEAGRTVCLTRR